MTLQKYKVTGMSCAACQARVEKAVNKVPGVTSVAVSLLTNSMGVEGDADAAAVIRAVEEAGYGASMQELALEDTETPKLRRRLIASVCLLVILMYGSMGHMMWGWPVPALFAENHVAMGIAEMILAGVIMVINGRFFTSGFKALVHLAPNMDTLVAMGSMTAFVWSVVVLCRMAADQAAGNEAAVMAGMHGLYFESAAMIVTLITIGKMLEAMSKGKTTDALRSLMQLAPQTAVIEGPDGVEREIPVGQLAAGDVFIVRPGANIPADGEIIEGNTAVNEAALTGESIPVDKGPGDPVSAATVNTLGYIKARATRVGEDTTLAQIIRMVSDAAATKAPIARIADRVSGVFVPVVIGIAALVILIWLLAGADTGYALARGISVLVISCPCALGLATPVAIMAGSGVGARNGILFKTAASLEMAGRTQIIALDKTGTITRGEPEVTDLIPAPGVLAGELLLYAASLEARSEHPIGQAILRKAAEEMIPLTPVSDFRALPGNGLQAQLNGRQLVGGSLLFMEQSGFGGSMNDDAQALAAAGKTPIAFALGEDLLGIIAVADTIKEDSPEAIRQMHQMGIRTVMLTGDNRTTARAIAGQAGVDEVAAGVLPAGKDAEIRRLQARGRVAMVGDGINDAPALTRADTGIAIGAGADVAIDAADVVLMNSRLSDVTAAIRLSRATLRNIRENLFWAFIYNILLIPMAAGAFTHFMGGWAISPMLGAAAMSLSSFCVCMNALRLNLLDIHDPKRDKPLHSPKRRRAAGVKWIRRLRRLVGKEPESLREQLKKTEKQPRIDRNGKRMPRPKRPRTSLEEGMLRLEELTEEMEAKGYFDEQREMARLAVQEETTMKKTLKIEGMMCTHCEAAVKKALEALDGVSEAAVSHEAGTAVVELTADVDDAALTKAVEDRDYKVLSIG